MQSDVKPQKRPYRPPVVRTEKVLVQNLYGTQGGCDGDPFCLAPEAPRG